MDTDNSTEKRIRRIFVVSVVIKGLVALFDIVAGIALLATGTTTAVVSFLVRHELVEDPTDFVAMHIRDLLPYLSSHTQLFGAFYLLSHGLIRMFLVWGLLRNKLWAYPASIGFLFLFMIYQTVALLRSHPFLLMLLTTFDLVVLWLVWHEYNILKRPRTRNDKTSTSV